MSIKSRMILSVIVVFLLGTAVIAFFMRDSYLAALDESARRSVTEASVIFAELEKADTAKLSATLRGMLDNSDYRELFVAKNRDGLYKATSPVFEDLKKDFRITHWYFEEAEASSTVFLRVHRPEQFDDKVKRKTYLQAVETKDYGSGLELGKTAVALRVVHPYYSQDGTTVVGYMELGQEIDGFLEQIKEQTGDDVALMLFKDKMDEKAWADYRAQKDLENNWTESDRYVAAAGSSEAVLEGAAAIDAVSEIPKGGMVIGVVADGARREVQGAFPVLDSGGEQIGAVYVEHDISQAASALLTERLTIMLVVIAMMLVVTVVVILLMNRLIFARLTSMMEGMEDISTRLAGGDFDVHYQPDGSSDEIGRFEEFFGRFIDVISGTFKQFTKK